MRPPQITSRDFVLFHGGRVQRALRARAMLLGLDTRNGREAPQVRGAAPFLRRRGATL